MKVCSFCEPQELAERIIESNELAVAFLSSPRLTPGHCLVIPTRHVELPSELNSQELIAIFSLINILHVRLLQQYDGVDIWQKSRPQVASDGFKMDHVHFHVIPSQVGEERYAEVLNWRRDQFAPLKEEERESMLALLKISTNPTSN